MENLSEDVLSLKQQKFLLNYFECKDLKTAFKKTGIVKQTYYTWLQDDFFKSELNRRQTEITETGFNIIKISVEKAVCILRDLLDSENENIKLRAANSIIDYYFKNKEISELEKRIENIEKNFNLTELN